MKKQYPKKLKQEIFLIILFITILFIIFHLPSGWIYNESNSICIHKRLFGIGCPLCGITRAAYDIVHFNFAKAIKENFNVLPLTITLICWIVYYFYPMSIIRKLCIIMLFVTLAGFIIVYTLRLCGLY